MKMITLLISESYIVALDSLVGQGNFPCRSEAVRLAVRDLLVKEGCLPKAEISEDLTEKLAVAMHLDKQMKFYKEHAGKVDYKPGLYWIQEKYRKQKEASE